MSEASVTERPTVSDHLPEKPSAVAQAASKADEMIRALAAQKNPQPPAGGQADAVPESPVAAPAAAGGEGTQPQPGTEKPQASPPADPTPAPAKESDTAALREEIAKLRQEVSTWRGRHDTETKREREARKAAEDKLAELQAQLEAAKAPPQDELTQDEIDTYGEDMLKVALRYVLPAFEKRLESALRALRAEFAGRIEAIEGSAERAESVVAQNEWEKFCQGVAARVPNWREIDVSPEFTAWLDEEDPVFGVPNRNALDSAGRTRNVERAARVFERFLSQQGARESQGKQGGATGAQPGTGAPPTAPAEASGPTDSLAAFAAPGKPSASQGSATPDLKPGAKVWTVAEIQQFYRTKSVAYRGREAEAEAIERDIFRAQTEGRVR